MKKFLLFLILSISAMAANAKEYVDVITASGLGLSSTSYKTFSGKKFKSSAVYAGAISVSSGNIQINSGNSSCKGIYTTASGGVVKKVTLYWASGNNASEIYASNTAYNGKPSETLVATMSYADKDANNATTYTFKDDYNYVAIYGKTHVLSKIEITWDDGNDDVDDSISQEFDFIKNTYGLTSSYTKSWSYTEDQISLTYTNGSGSGIRLYSDGLRFYTGKMTVAANDGYVITNIEIEATSTAFTIGGTTGLFWSGRAQSVDIVAPSSNGKAISKIIVTYEAVTKGKQLDITNNDGQAIEFGYDYVNCNYTTTGNFMTGSKITVASKVASKVGVMLPGETEATYYNSPYTLAITAGGKYKFTDSELLDGETALSDTTIINATVYNPIEINAESTTADHQIEEIDGEKVNAIHVMFSINDVLSESTNVESYNLYVNGQYLESSEDGDFYIEYLPFAFNSQFAVSPVVDGEEIGRYDVALELPEIGVEVATDESKNEFAYAATSDMVNVHLRVYVAASSTAIYDLEAISAGGHNCNVLNFGNGIYYIEVEDYIKDVPVIDGQIHFTEEQLNAAAESVDVVISPIYKFAVKDTTSRAAGVKIVTVRGEALDLGEVKLDAETGKISGIESIVAESDNNAIYYNLQGVRVANPDNGIYIRLQNGKATKVNF